MEFRAWIEELIEKRYGGVATRLAGAIGMSVSAFQRSSREGTLSLENLLRLAEETGEPAPNVLEMAGKGEIAALIFRLYGEPTRPTLSRPALQFAELFDALNDEGMKRFVVETLNLHSKAQHERNAALGAATPATASGKSRRRGNPRR